VTQEVEASAGWMWLFKLVGPIKTERRIGADSTEKANCFGPHCREKPLK
jgi:hypothetical protein